MTGYLAVRRPHGWVLVGYIDTWIYSRCGSSHLTGMSAGQRCVYCDDCLGREQALDLSE